MNVCLNASHVAIISKIQLKRTIIDRMIYLMSTGYVIPILSFINDRWKDEDTDVSLIRHFVIEVNLN